MDRNSSLSGLQPISNSTAQLTVDRVDDTNTCGTGGRSAADRETMKDGLDAVLSHFDIGAIRSVKEFTRGSRQAPKLILRSDQGTFLLKRRARGKDDALRVAFSHELQLELTSKRFPLPRLIGMKKDNRSMLQYDGATYELFEFIKGTSYDHSIAATDHAAHVLALFHKLLLEYEPKHKPPPGSYHAAPSVAASFHAIPDSIAKMGSSTAQLSERMNTVIRFLDAAYSSAAHHVNDLDLMAWPTQIVHCDWHPGNMLFRGTLRGAGRGADGGSRRPRVVSVMDYDSARIQQRVIDVANGALQFSMLGGSDDVSTWPAHVDASRYERFVRAYDSVSGCVLTKLEIRTIPWLMIEALIAEAVIPIAATGSFARMEGIGFLEMIERKVRWIQSHIQQLTQVLEA